MSIMGMMSNGKIKRIIAGLMIPVMSLMIPGVHVTGASKTSKQYIKEFRMFVGTGAVVDREQACIDWCKSQGEDWHYFNDNLNKGAEGMFSESRNIYLCYQTTTDPDEAVRDIAVMNELGNYNSGEYEVLLKEQKDTYAEMVSDLKDMRAEYAKNYKAGVPTAVQAHDVLNKYIEDDSGKLLGNLLIDADDETLVDVLMQANGQVTLFMQQQLTYACENANGTWLDRMEKLGGYDKLRAKALKAAGGNAAKADTALDKSYKDDAEKLANIWESIKEHIDHYKGFAKKYKFTGMSADEILKWKKDNMNNSDVYLYEQEESVITGLASYKYEDATLFDFFNQSYEDIRGENLKKLYPLAACLSVGQQAGANEYVSLFKLAQMALDANITNDYDKGKNAEVMKDASKDMEEFKDDCKKDVEKAIDTWVKEEKISVYEGVDREIFKGGVAVTSPAFDFSKSAEKKWAYDFVDSGQYGIVMRDMCIATAVSGVLATACKILYSANYNSTISNTIAAIEGNAYPVIFEKYGGKISKATYDYIKTVPADHGYDTVEDMIIERALWGNDKDVKAFNELDKAVWHHAPVTKFFYAMKIGLTVLTVLMCVADVVLTVVALSNYYNRDHLPIPGYMVDITYNEDKETSYTNYKAVKDQNGGNSDFNGGNGKQWLALYQTKDEWAGDPILAPENGKSCDLICQRKDSKLPTDEGYAPLHMFGEPGVAQNLTFADGEKGFSFNDKEGGTYLFFRRDSGLSLEIDQEITEEDDNDNTSDGDKSATGAGVSAVGAAAGVATALVSGSFIWIVLIVLIGCGTVTAITVSRRRRKNERKQ
ncbi:MAG: hypothetical protein IJ807_05605 [Eubacterium sp.]|nr:hypothetical protein [Eubacterium sp.]